MSKLGPGDAIVLARVVGHPRERRLVGAQGRRTPARGLRGPEAAERRVVRRSTARPDRSSTRRSPKRSPPPASCRTTSANITGHGWRKVMRHPAALTYRFHTLPEVPEVLRFLQQRDRQRRPRRLRQPEHGRWLRAVRRGRRCRTHRADRRGGWRACARRRQGRGGPKQVVLTPLGLTFGADDLHVRA